MQKKDDRNPRGFRDRTPADRSGARRADGPGPGGFRREKPSNVVVGRNAVAELIRSGAPVDKLLVSGREGSIVAIVAACAFVTLVVTLFPRTKVGKKLALPTDLKESRADDLALASLAGAEGVADTTLRPAGFATFGDRRVDVVTRGDEIPAGTRVRVVEVEGNRVVVARA